MRREVAKCVALRPRVTKSTNPFVFILLQKRRQQLLSLLFTFSYFRRPLFSSVYRQRHGGGSHIFQFRLAARRSLHALPLTPLSAALTKKRVGGTPPQLTRISKMDSEKRSRSFRRRLILSAMSGDTAEPTSLQSRSRCPGPWSLISDRFFTHLDAASSVRNN